MKWEIFKKLDIPCADISYKWDSEENAKLIIIMHFSRVVNGCNEDLELIFDNPIAFQWEDERFGLIDLPEELPRITNINYKSWTYPTLIIPNSKWVDLYAQRLYTEEEYLNHKLKHFALISLNDLIHILSEKMPYTKLIKSVDE